MKLKFEVKRKKNAWKRNMVKVRLVGHRSTKIHYKTFLRH